MKITAYPKFCRGNFIENHFFLEKERRQWRLSTASSGRSAHTKTVTMPQDSRKVVGGAVWAKAEAVSHDCKRIYGALSSKTWLEGLVQEVIVSRPAGSKRATTYIKALFVIGTGNAKEKVLPLQSLKSEDPNPPPPAAAPAVNDAAALVPRPPSPSAADATPPVPPVANEEEEEAGDKEGSSSSNSTGVPKPVATAHEREWFEGPVDVDVNGPVPAKFWKMVCQWKGHEFYPGCDCAGAKPRFKPIDFFLATFPKKQLFQMVDRTSKKLQSRGKQPTTAGEILKWFGVTVLITRFEFGSRSTLWSRKQSTKYIPAAAFGDKVGMFRDRWEELFSSMVWSEQPDNRPDDVNCEAYRWMRVSDFVDNINAHRQKFYTPSSTICVDESMSRWYGLGGFWINVGLPQYVAMDRKPEDGCEIQNAADGSSGVMMRLKLVKTAEEEARYDSCILALIASYHLLLLTLFFLFLLQTLTGVEQRNKKRQPKKQMDMVMAATSSMSWSSLGPTPELLLLLTATLLLLKLHSDLPLLDSGSLVS